MAAMFTGRTWHTGIGKSEKLLEQRIEKGYNMIISNKITNRDLHHHLESTLQYEEFISDYLEKQLAPVYHLLPPTTERLKLDVSELGTFRFSEDYVNRMRWLLIQRFDNCDTDNFDNYLWRLLHEDALALNTIEINKADPHAAAFWLRVLGAIAIEEGDARSDSETVTLESRAIQQVSFHLDQLASKVLLNKDKREVWAALNDLSARMGRLTQHISKNIELKINDDLSEDLLDEWLTHWSEDYPVNGYHAKELKKALLSSKHVGKTLEELTKEPRSKVTEGCTGDDTLDKLIEDAARSAWIDEANDREEDEIRYGSDNQ